MEVAMLHAAGKAKGWKGAQEEESIMNGRPWV